ncbi:2Fe-2S iron-sulfur cluster-binding protein [Micromonospora yasonensis]|uniref:2Fe-2S iron-sulfur cluster-binding protein n=1 Tax=Micromonospora yasonensis TaxID=1128667 RepID=UPI002232B7FF|nr:2Fe-2S iron-sulfur cluster-binding protein [Micromonospora yasonensis]MCW3839992.1 2Fe-2S iron-sulfur cluster-binding protein [Micromonospora yasonensis]
MRSGRESGKPAEDGRSSPVALTVNGVRHDLTLDNRATLLDALRERLALIGSKKGCDHGQCGSCTVLLDGRRVKSCLILAVTLDGRAVVTVEGLAGPEDLSPLQAAFVARDAFQCGYCTPGQLCSARGMLDEVARDWPSAVTEDLTAPVELTDAEVRERMSGNLCRCAAYPNIVAAIRDAAAAR